MSRSTLQILGAMVLALAAAAAFQVYSAPGVDMDAPASDAPYKYELPKTVQPAANAESFRYVQKETEKIQLAPEKASVSDLTPEMKARLGIRPGKNLFTPQKLDPTVEAVLKMMPRPEGNPHIENARPRLISPTTAQAGGSPITEESPKQ